MTDPLGLIGAGSPLQPDPRTGAAARPAEGGVDFVKLLHQQIEKVDALQRDATEATEDLLAGRRNDVESVMIATKKADTAFRMLLQVRNKIVEAYDEVKQIRV